MPRRNTSPNLADDRHEDTYNLKSYMKNLSMVNFLDTHHFPNP
jgi:hypothetical protein